MYLLLLGTAISALALCFALHVAATVRNEALRPTRNPPAPTVEILDVRADRLTLRPIEGIRNDLWRQEGRWGLRWEGGHARIGSIVNLDDSGHVVREFESFVGSPQPGIRARIDWAAHPDDPRLGFGLEFESVHYTSPLGRFHAAYLAGGSDTWVVFVHGKRGVSGRKPPYAYPILPLAAGRGFPCLDVTYRNDADAPSSEDGFHRYGITEWEDVEGAIRYAADHGASHFILVGYSMGGAIVTSFLYRSRLANRVRGIILDAPVLDLNGVIRSGVQARGIPHSLIRPGLWLAGIRYRIDWRALDYLEEADRLNVPILLFHGAADPLVPVEASDRLAALRPDIVTYVRVPGATHGHSWNVAVERYERAVSLFLDRLGP